MKRRGLKQPPPPPRTLAQDAKRLMPGLDVAAMLRANPNMVLSLMKGKHLITYDQIDNPFS